MISIGAIFPGQGSQHVGMGKYLVDNFKQAAQRFDEASEILHLDCRKLCSSGNEQDLKLTENTQPLLVLVSVASYEVLHDTCGLEAAAYAGHSVGEYSALVSAGAITFSDAIGAVRVRGRAMQKASPPGEGGMCAVMGLADDQVRELCEWVEAESSLKPLSPANFNAPGQVVVSGRQTAIDWMVANFKNKTTNAEAKPARVKFIPLKVSAPFHCSLMEPAEKEMRTVLSGIAFRKPSHPIVQNFSAQFNSEPELIREQLIRQITAPVLWTNCMRTMIASGIKTFIECGPGQVLAGLAKRLSSEDLKVLNFNSIEDLKLIESTKWI